MEQSELLTRFLDTLDRLNLSYLITGSVATSYYGEPRFTNDIDVIVELTQSDVDTFCQAFPNDEFYLSVDAVRSAVRDRRQFNILHPTTGLKVDVFVLQNSAFDRSRFDRRMQFEVEEERTAWFASPEDVILKKMVYYKEGSSEKHIRDILGVLQIQGEKIDRDYIQSWATRLDLTNIWKEICSLFEGK